MVNFERPQGAYVGPQREYKQGYKYGQQEGGERGELGDTKYNWVYKHRCVHNPRNCLG